MTTPPSELGTLGISFEELRRVLSNCCSTHQEVLYLSLWRKYNSISISYFLDMRLGLVEAYIRDGLSRIEHIAKTTKAISTSHISPAPECLVFLAA